MTKGYIDFRKRCIVEGGTEYPYDVIYYGLTANDMSGARDLPEPVKRERGRRPGDPPRFRQHFFNKRVMLDDEKYAGRPAVQVGGDAGSVGARDGAGGERGAQEVEACSGSTGSGDRDAGTDSD